MSATPEIGRSLIDEIGAAPPAASEPNAYEIRLKGAHFSEVVNDRADFDAVVNRAPYRAFGRTWVRFGDDTIVDPEQIALFRSISREEAVEITAEQESQEHAFAGVEALRAVLEKLPRPAAVPATPYVSPLPATPGGQP